MKFILLLVFFIYAKTPSMPQKTLLIGKNVILKVEVADNFKNRRTGLMKRTELAANRGMLFVFDKPQKLSFWMADTYVPLSIGYFDKNRRLKEIHLMKPQNMMEKKQHSETYPSRCLCLYALEVNQGWFKKNNIRIGDRFKFKN